MDERDLAHEHDMEILRREQLRANVSLEDAEAELADIEWEESFFDDEEYMGDPDEYDGQ